MKLNEEIECPFCGGYALFEVGDYADPKLLSHDCDISCENHPNIDPKALFNLLENGWEGRAGRAYADYHGGDGPVTQAERDEVFRQQNPRGI